MSDWSGLKRDALRAQPFNSTDYAVASLGSRASDVLELIAENESLRADAERYRFLMSSAVYNGTLGIHDGWIDFEFKDEAQEAIDAAISSPENP